MHFVVFQEKMQYLNFSAHDEHLLLTENYHLMDEFVEALMFHERDELDRFVSHGLAFIDGLAEPLSPGMENVRTYLEAVSAASNGCDASAEKYTTYVMIMFCTRSGLPVSGSSAQRCITRTMSLWRASSFALAAQGPV